MPNKDPIKRKVYMQGYYKNNKKRFRDNDKIYKQKNKDKIEVKRKANPEREKLYRRNSTLKRKFGITLEQYEIMVLSQKGLCYLCGSKCVTGNSLAVDHCHKTGRVRRLLCLKCNTGLGCFRDNTKLLEDAIEYLKNN